MAQAPSAFTGRAQSPWYEPKGLFLEPPSLALVAGRWRACLPPAMLARWHVYAARPGGEVGGQDAAFQRQDDGEGELLFGSREQALDLAARRARGRLAAFYAADICDSLAQAEAEDAEEGDGQQKQLAALLLEPAVHGAGGMVLVDPLYQVRLESTVLTTPQSHAGVAR